jgi:hypothetical protein
MYKTLLYYKNITPLTYLQYACGHPHLPEDDHKHSRNMKEVCYFYNITWDYTFMCI